MITPYPLVDSSFDAFPCTTCSEPICSQCMGCSCKGWECTPMEDVNGAIRQMTVASLQRLEEFCDAVVNS